MTQYTVDKSFDMKQTVMICEHIDDTQALRVLYKHSLSTFMATDESGEAVVVAQFNRRYYPILGDCFTGWIITN